MTCPICGSSSHPEFEKHGHTILTCDTCEHQFIKIPRTPDHTNQIYTDRYFYEGGDGYLDYTSESDLLIAHGERYGNLLKKYMEPGSVFDVGSAAGFILKGLTNKGWIGKGIEPNNTMAEYARHDLHMDVVTGIFEQHMVEETFDLVTMVQVIAHFYDVRRAIEITNDLLKDDGYLLIESWDRASFPVRILGSNWHEYSPPSVVNWFSADGLTTLVKQFGFEEIARGRPDKRLNGAHAKSLVRYKLETMPGGKLLGRLLGIIPDHLQIPYPSFDLFWILYQKS